jgi:hypothetical protein
MSGFYTPPNVRGEDKQIQYNENGVLSASSDLIWDDATKDLTVGGNLDVAWHTELDDLNVSGVSTFQNNVSIAGTITELYNGQYWNVVTQADVGYGASYGASQVPLNQYLGQLAFLDDYHPNGLRRDGGGSDDVVVGDDGFVGIGTTYPTANLDVNSNSIRLRTAKTPASATDTGEEGQICWDADYVYVCIGTNTWKRSAISTWS